MGGPLTLPGEPVGDGTLVVSGGDYLWFVDRALDTMTGIVGQLGDELANRRPSYRHSNSPYAILTHCLGMLEYWGGATVAERPVRRDRAAEFTARGDVAGLLRRAEQARRRLREDLVGFDSWAVPSNVQRTAYTEGTEPYARTKGAVLVHIVEELFQHLGQMELTRDALMSATRQ